MEARFIAQGELQTLKDELASFEQDKDSLSLLFMMADEEHYSQQDLDPLLRNFKKPVIGGVFPELIFRGEPKKTGVILLPLSFTLNCQLFDLSQTQEEYINQLELIQKDSIDTRSALFVFVDALSAHKEFFIEALFNFFGINPSYIGGGAGSLKFKPFPCIISNQGMTTDAAVIGWAAKEIAIGYAHGWGSVSKPLKVTKAFRNTIISINWMPAFEVYKEIVETHSGMKFTADNFFHIAKSYPLGITKIDAEMVVRDPFMVSDNVMFLVDVVNEGEYVEILHGNLDSLLTGAAKAKEIAFSRFGSESTSSTVFCIDCISRVLFMQNDFEKELEVIGKSKDLTGILTIGEIANSGESFLEIFNKTIVIGIW